MHHKGKREKTRRKKQRGTGREDALHPQQRISTEEKESQREDMQSSPREYFPAGETQAEVAQNQASSDMELKEEEWCKKEKIITSGPKPSTYLNRKTPPRLLQSLATSTSKIQHEPEHIEKETHQSTQSLETVKGYDGAPSQSLETVKGYDGAPSSPPAPQTKT